MSGWRRPSGRDSTPPSSADGVDALAVGALISAVMFAPLGIVLGLIALQRARARDLPTGLPTAAITVGVVVLGAFLVVSG